MRLLSITLFLVVGLANLLPLVGVLSTVRLQMLYGVSIEDPNLAILMRHRAVLFGIVGTLLLSAAFSPAFRPA